MDDHFGVGSRLEDGPTPHKIAPQGHRVRDIAIMRNGKAAGCEIGIERLHVAQRCFARRRIAHMTGRTASD